MHQTELLQTGSIGTFGPESVDLNRELSAFENAFLGFPDDPKPVTQVINVFTRDLQTINVPGFGDVRLFLRGLQEPTKGEVTTTNPFRLEQQIIVSGGRLAELDVLRTGQAGSISGGISGFIDQVIEDPSALSELPLVQQLERGGVLGVLEGAFGGAEEGPGLFGRIGIGLIVVAGIGVAVFAATR